MLEMEHRHGARAERRAVLAAVEHGKAEHVTVKSGESGKIAHLEADRADMQRGAAREGGGGGRVWGVHSGYIGLSWPLRNTLVTRGCCGKPRFAIGSRHIGRSQPVPGAFRCPSTPPPSAASRTSHASP